MIQSSWDKWLETVIIVEPAARQLSCMWRLHNRNAAHHCGNCVHLIVHPGNTKHYFKCELYGVTSGAATDWRKKWVACGRWELSQ